MKIHIINKIYSNINLLRKQKNAIILAHYYQLPEIQEIADFVGDSYALSKVAKNTKADIIVFAGVKFMAETAKILNSGLKVLLPDIEAGCSLADSCPEEDFLKFRKLYPEHIVITYINSSVEIKTHSDIICTSSNAVKIVNSIPSDKKILFAPDRNLGKYIISQTGRNMILWDGACHVHNQLHVESVIKLKEQYHNALILAHPECQGPILNIADFIGSTSQIIDFTEKSEKKQFIIATETGVTHEMKKKSPDKEFYIVPANESCNCNDCNFMKMITLNKILRSLQEEIYEIQIPDTLQKKALKPIEKMIEIAQ